MRSLSIAGLSPRERDTLWAMTWRRPGHLHRRQNFLRTYDEPANVAYYDNLVALGWLKKESVPGHCYRVTEDGLRAIKAYGRDIRT